MKTAAIMLGGIGLVLWKMSLGGCATMVDGSTQKMSFQTTPEDVVVTLIRPINEGGDYWAEKDKQGQRKTMSVDVERRILGKTPFTLALDRAEGQSVVFSKEGYTPVTMSLTTTTNPWFWGNIFFGGLFATTTDSTSGAIYEYEPSQFLVTLKSDPSTPISQSVGQADRDKALAFIVRRHSAVLASLSQGTGEDWTALMGLLHIAPAQEADARQKLKALALVYPDAGTFATHVTDLYLK